MKLIFAKTKRARVICALLSLALLVLAVYAAYFAIGNLRCTADSPVLIAESGGAVFLGYYLLAGAYFLLFAIAALLCILFAVNARLVARR